MDNENEKRLRSAYGIGADIGALGCGEPSRLRRFQLAVARCQTAGRRGASVPPHLKMMSSRTETFLSFNFEPASHHILPRTAIRKAVAGLLD